MPILDISWLLGLISSQSANVFNLNQLFLFTPATAYIVIWVCLFTLFYYSPSIGLGHIWEARIHDYKKISIKIPFLICISTIIVFAVSSVIKLLIIKSYSDIEWWYGLAIGFCLGLVIFLGLIIENDRKNMLHKRLIDEPKPDSWGLIWVKCGYCLILSSVAGLILTAFK